MSRHALLSYLCLLASIEFLSAERKFLIAPGKSTDENFAVVQFEENTKSFPHKLIIQLRIYSQQTDDFKQCSLTLTSRWGAVKSGVNALKRLTGDKVIFAWYDEMLDGSDRRTRIYTMNDSCNSINPVLENLPGRPIVLPSVANQFDVIVEDEVTCRAIGKRCRVSYNFNQGNVGRVWPLDVNLDWSTMKVERLRNGDFLVRGYDGTTYYILQVNQLTSANTTLLTQFEAKPEPGFVTSDLSICGIVCPGYDRFAQCTQFDEKSNVLLEKRAWFDEPVTLIDVHSLSDGGLFLLAGKIKCNDEFDCWKLYGMELREREKGEMKPSYSHFHCTGDRRDLRVFDVTLAGDRIAVRYACKDDEEYSYNTNYFDVDDDWKY